MKILLPLLFLLIALPAFAQTPSAPVPAVATAVTAGINASDAYAFATAPAQTTGAAFLTILNNSGTPDRLLSASSSVAGSAEINNTLMEQDTMMMVKMNALDIPAGETVTLDPNSYHIMLTNLHGPLNEGQIFPLKLIFEKRGEVNVDVMVRAPGETEAEPDPAAAPPVTTP